jgi:transposase
VLCDSYAELAEELDLSEASVSTRANKLRKLGVNLPKYAKAAKPIDVDALNALIVNQQ